MYFILGKSSGTCGTHTKKNKDVNGCSFNDLFARGALYDWGSSHRAKLSVCLHLFFSSSNPFLRDKLKPPVLSINSHNRPRVYNNGTVFLFVELCMLQDGKFS